MIELFSDKYDYKIYLYVRYSEVRNFKFNMDRGFVFIFFSYNIR